MFDICAKYFKSSSKLFSKFVLNGQLQSKSTWQLHSSQGWTGKQRLQALHIRVCRVHVRTNRSYPWLCTVAVNRQEIQPSTAQQRLPRNSRVCRQASTTLQRPTPQASTTSEYAHRLPRRCSGLHLKPEKLRIVAVINVFRIICCVPELVPLPK